MSAEALEDAEVAETGSVLQLLLRSQALWTSPQCRKYHTARLAQTGPPLQGLAIQGPNFKVTFKQRRQLIERLAAKTRKAICNQFSLFAKTVRS